MPLKLLVDIGNTNISLAVARGKRIIKKYFMRTSRPGIDPSSFRRLLGKHMRAISSVTAVSVVPGTLSVIRATVRKTMPGVKVNVVGKDVKVPIRIRYASPEEVGQDRLVTAFAASRIFGAPVLVVDFGTAVTFDLVGRSGEYRGGFIFPGLRISLNCLVEEAALLPSTELRPVRGFMGRSTRDSMNKGILFGYAAMCDGLIGSFRERYGKNMLCVATGGDASLVAKHSRYIDKVSSDLILKGLIALD